MSGLRDSQACSRLRENPAVFPQADLIHQEASLSWIPTGVCEEHICIDVIRRKRWGPGLQPYPTMIRRRRASTCRFRLRGMNSQRHTPFVFGKLMASVVLAWACCRIHKQLNIFGCIGENTPVKRQSTFSLSHNLNKIVLFPGRVQCLLFPCVTNSH